MITILVLTDSSLQMVIAYQVEDHYAKARMNYGLKCALPEKTDKSVNINTCQKGRFLEHQLLIILHTSFLLLVSKNFRPSSCSSWIQLDTAS